MSPLNKTNAHTFEKIQKRMGIFSFLGFGGKTTNSIADFIERGALIIDVRTTGEFAAGHITNSKNIPLDSLLKQIDGIKKLNKPVIACCRSGMRSSQAVSILKQHQVECMNGGSWDSLQAKL